MITGVKIVLENCEVFKFPFNQIAHLKIDNFCNYIVLVLKPEANNPNNFMGIKHPLTPFERLQAYNDITHIVFVGDDNSEVEYIVPYKGDEINEWQSSKMIQGCLYLYIRGE